MKRVYVSPYQAKWKNEFVRLCKHLTKILEEEVFAIRPVGSTTVEGCHAKPILDVDVVLKHSVDLPSVRALLEKRGYYFRGDLGIPERFAFGYGSSSFMRHHLYVVLPQSDAYLSHIALRDRLRANTEYLEEYSRVKLEMADRFPNDIDAYIDGKGETIRKIKASETGRTSYELNGQPHTRQRIDSNTILLKTEGDFPGEIRFTLHPFQAIRLIGEDKEKKHLLGLAEEIAIGYKKSVDSIDA